MKRKRGFVPAYWWDFVWSCGHIDHIAVKTDDPQVRGGVVMTFGPNGSDAADRYVEHMKAGRTADGVIHWNGKEG